MIMPLSMKIQPIDVRDLPEPPTKPEYHPAKPPVVRSRLKRLFRISIADKSVTAGGADEILAPTATDQLVEPSSVCLAKMVQNFIEDSNEKHASSPAVKCGRHRCNCFNGNGSEGSDGEHDATDAYDFLKSLVMCANLSERNVLADTSKIVERNGKGCKRKGELRKSVAEGLVALGYDAGVCKSKWEKSPSFPAGEYEYVDVILGETGERLIVDIDFRSEFEIARSTKAYKTALQMLPYIFVGKPDRLAKIVSLASEAARISLKKKGLHFPPWRKAEYVQAKWLSPHTRTRLGGGPAGPLVYVESSKPVYSSDHPPLPRLSCEKGEEEEGSSMDDQPLFVMSESSGEEDVKTKQKKDAKKPMELKSQSLDLDGPTNLEDENP
ncbi:hypothetical protein V2J09_015629 [Rumex salicifolius]